MKKRGLQPTIRTYNNLIAAYTKEKRNPEIEEILKRIKEDEAKGVTPDYVTYTLLLNSCVAENDYEKAKSLFDAMRSRGFEPTHDAYALLILAVKANAGELEG